VARGELTEAEYVERWGHRGPDEFEVAAPRPTEDPDWRSRVRGEAADLLARELGIPAVVGCGDATMRLRTGDRVRVDGTEGGVTLL
jgi:hypothetical protein